MKTICNFILFAFCKKLCYHICIQKSGPLHHAACLHTKMVCGITVVVSSVSIYNHSQTAPVNDAS